MSFGEFVVGHILIAGCAGLIAMRHIARWKLSTESIDSPKFVTRWTYRYLVFLFFFLLASLLVAPITTWQIVKIPTVQAIVSSHPWLLLVLTAIPASALYYLNRRYLIWCDPVKIGARQSALDYWRSKAGR